MTNSTQESKTYIIHFRQQTLFAFRISHSLAFLVVARAREPRVVTYREKLNIPSHSFFLTRTQCVVVVVLLFFYSLSLRTLLFFCLFRSTICVCLSPSLLLLLLFFNSLFLSSLTYSALCYFFLFFILIPLYIALTLLFFVGIY